MRALMAAAAFLCGVGMGACAPAQSGEWAMRGADELRAAATRVSAGPVTLRLEVEAWRSFQPTIGDVGDPLIAILRVHAEDQAEVPGAVTVDGVYLMRGAEVVHTVAREEQPREENARTVEFVVRDGPRWAAGDSIEVVAEVSGSGGPPVLLRAPRVSIVRVD